MNEERRIRVARGLSVATLILGCLAVLCGLGVGVISLISGPITTVTLLAAMGSALGGLACILGATYMLRRARG